MDIKNALNSILPIQGRIKSEARKDIRSDEATDRDANGQMPGEDGNGDQEPLTEQELQEALSQLRKMPAIIQQGLMVKLLVSHSKRFVIIQEPMGRVVRRIPENELKALLKTDPESPKGQLLNKGA